MTTTLVREKPIHTELKMFDVDNTIAGNHTAMLINNTSFLLARNVEPIFHCTPSKVQLIKPNSATLITYACNIEWFYQRSPDVTHVMIGYENYPTIRQWNTGRWSFTVLLTPPATVVEATPSDLVPFNVGVVTATRLDDPNFPQYFGIFDVSQLPTGSLSLFRLTQQGHETEITSKAEKGGISKIFMQELPKSSIVVSATEQTGSVDVLSTTPYRYVVDGSAQTEFGYARILDQTKVARARVRNHFQIANFQETDEPSSTHVMLFNSTVEAQITMPQLLDAANYKKEFWIRTRNYDGIDLSATPPAEKNYYTLAVRYRTALNTAPNSYFYVNMTTEPNGYTNQVQLTLPSSLTWATATVQVPIQCDSWTFTKEQLVKLNFTGKCDDASQTVYIGTIALIEDETL